MLFWYLVCLCIIGILLIYEDEFNERLPLDRAKTFAEKIRGDLNLWVIKKNKSGLDKELYNSSVIIKNLSLVRRDSPISADYIYEKLAENSTMLRPIYGQMLTLYRNKKDSEAFKVLPMIMGTKDSRNFAIILSKLDKLNPYELKEELELFQKSMRERRKTHAIKRVQRNSLILTVMSTITAFAVLLNFIVIVVFMSTLDLLNEVFI